jgi:alkanesulfonate monooxygenase SsuD/methylene tetrahydromethanopterin reductase-like flavin-dependent oxidoreductase (luciferase family)
MRAGIVILPDQRWSIAAQQWRRAEAYGFVHARTYDHIGWRDLVGGPWFDNVPTLTAAALATSRIRLGTMVASPNFGHPPPLRARGHRPRSHRRRPIGPRRRGRRRRRVRQPRAGPGATHRAVAGGPVRRSVGLLDRILRDERVTWHGRYYTVVDARATPGCVQSPRVPFVVAAIGPRSMRLAARYGAGWVTTGARKRI